jgi:hypothetical protein
MSIVTEERMTPETSEILPDARRRSTDQGQGSTAAKWATAIILIGSIVLIFTRLGHYALWDDEAITAMTARGVWRTGDTSAWADDHNLLAYRNGLLINHFADRYTPPLQFYLLAPFMGLLGESSFVCRLPFAICGVISVVLMLRWMWRAKPEPVVWWGAAVLILTNASFFLFQRNCRYYALATVLTVAAGYLYYRWNTARSPVWPLSIVLAVLLSAQYLNYAAAIGCLVVDYFLWGRKRRTLSIADWVVLMVPQLVVGGFVCSIWNPVARSIAATGKWATDTSVVSNSVATVPHSWFHGFLHLYWWNWRDMLACDFLVLPLLLLCPLMFFKRRNNWLLRAPAALFVYLAVIAAATAHVVGEVGNAEVRYLAPALPLCLAISILAVWGMATLKRGLLITALCVAGISMVIEPEQDGDKPELGSTAIQYYHELIVPQREPFTPAIAWIKANIPAGKSLLVMPDWMPYPLMFRASGPVYAWQLTDPPKAEYANLPDIQFEGRVAPDYLIAFGPFTKEMGEARAKLAKRGIEYTQIETIHEFWRDRYRPERIWRFFSTPNPKPDELIYIYRRTDLH